MSIANDIFDHSLIHLAVWFQPSDSRDLLRFNPPVGELNLSVLDKIAPP